MSKVVCFDWDGTLTTFNWPGWGDWQPGAVETLQTLHRAGITCLVSSARLSPYVIGTWPAVIERDPGEVAREEFEMRRRLDEAGCGFVHIWTSQYRGKPLADLYIDDLALRYPGRTKSWQRLIPVILEKVGIDAGGIIE